MPDREARLGVMVDMLEVARGKAPRVLDLAGGTGSITRRVLARLPEATSVVVDLDPALLALAAGTFHGDARVTVVHADLSRPTWRDALGGDHAFDAALTATALHWLEADRVRALYAEVHGLLAPGGILGNADHMPDPGLAWLDEAFAALGADRAAAYRATHGATDWDGWWDELATEPAMGPHLEARRQVHGPGAGTSHTRSTMPSSWHEAALADAGFTSVGLAWRALGDALVVGVG